MRRLFFDRRLVTFGICAFLFHLSNAAMLPLAAAQVTKTAGDGANLIIAGCIVVPQAVVAVASPWVGRRANTSGTPADPSGGLGRLAGARPAPSVPARPVSAGGRSVDQRDQRGSVRGDAAPCCRRPHARPRAFQSVHGGLWAVRGGWCNSQYRQWEDGSLIRPGTYRPSCRWRLPARWVRCWSGC